VKRTADSNLSQRIMSLIFGAIPAQTLYVAAKLGIADELAGGPLSVDELATRTSTNADALYRILRALAVEGVFEVVKPRTFAVTELGRLISEDAPGSRRYDSLMFAEHVAPVFEHMLESVRTGQPAASLVFGMPYFDWLAEHPEAAETFNKAMESGATARLPTLLTLDLWDEVTHVVDVGGGNATALVALLKAHPQLHGVVLDLPHVRGEAEAVIGAAGLGDRCEFVGGSFFESVPEGGDVYVLLQILPDWNDADATRILHSCREAIPEQGRLVVVEYVLTDEEGDGAKWLDVLMLVLLGGRERTEAEWLRLLSAGRFEVERIRAGARASAIEARPN
jgi:O-methyltransferase domain